MKTGLMMATAMTLGLSGGASAQNCSQTHPATNQVWVPDRYDYRERQIVIPAEYRTVTRELWVEPHYEWATRRVWVPNHRPASKHLRFSFGEFSFGYDLAGRRSSSGYYRTVRERVVVYEGHYKTIEEVVCVRPERVQTVREPVLVEAGHWEVVLAHR